MARRLTDEILGQGRNQRIVSAPLVENVPLDNVGSRDPATLMADKLLRGIGQDGVTGSKPGDTHNTMPPLRAAPTEGFEHFLELRSAERERHMRNAAEEPGQLSPNI